MNDNKRPRPFLTMRISPGTPLYAAWLPKRKKEEPDGTYLVHMDPVEFQAVMASAGNFYTLDETIAAIKKLQGQSNSQGETADESQEESRDIPEEENEPRLMDEAPADDLELP